MVYLNVYFNGVFQEQVALDRDVTTVGRGEDNDIQIDNPGVSTQHAMVVREGDDYFVMDAKSKNGTYVNGAPVTRKKLEYGDMITILKHTLKVTPLAAEAEKSATAHEKHAVENDGTIDMDVSQLDKLLKQHGPVRRGYLWIRNKDGSQRKRPLDRASFTIGKDPMSDLVIKGWFVPRSIASIDRRVDGYYLVPSGRGQLQLNGTRVGREARLGDGDTLTIKRTEMKFILEQPETPEEKA